MKEPTSVGLQSPLTSLQQLIMLQFILLRDHFQCKEQHIWWILVSSFTLRHFFWLEDGHVCFTTCISMCKYGNNNLKYSIRVTYYSWWGWTVCAPVTKEKGHGEIWSIRYNYSIKNISYNRRSILMSSFKNDTFECCNDVTRIPLT